MLTQEELNKIALKHYNNELEIIDPWDRELGHKQNCLRIYRYNNYAIKCIHLGLDENHIHLDTIKNGYNITKDLDHPGIIKSHGFFSNNTIAFTVYDYIGKTFKDMLDVLSNEQKNNIMDQIKDAIHYLWENEITHYDLTSRNVLLRSNLEPVIIDFQVAKKMKQPLQFENCIDMTNEKIHVQNCCGICWSVNFHILKEEVWKKA